MMTYLCDRCGKACKQVLHIAVTLEHTGYCEPWSDRDVEGDYCQDCFDRIAEAAHKKDGDGE